MVTPLRLSIAAALAVCVSAVPAYAQPPSDPAPAPAPANLAYVTGSVDVVQDGLTEPADPPVLLIEGDVVRTHNGRAEIVFGDGTLLHLADQSELEILGDEHLRLTAGRLIVRVSHAAARPYVIDTPASSVQLAGQGEYALAADRAAQLEVAVTRGLATIDAGRAWTLGGGQMLLLRGPGARPLIQAFNTARWDPFTQWSYERAQGLASSYSASRLPYELRPYATVLDQYGRWDYVAPHGFVWFPAVSVGWRPYYDGSWSFTRYGWTWRGHDRWAWPTHHYGRWGFSGMSWYWIPATVWAPAWVSWSIAPGYVGWAPIGWHSRVWPRADHPAYTPRYDPWRGWTVVSREHFAPRRPIRPHVIAGDRLDDLTRRTILSQAVTRSDDVAVPRGSVPSPGARGNVRRPTSVQPTAPPDARPGDHPAYAPPAAWRSAERPAAIRPSGRGRTPTDSPSGARPVPDGARSRGGDGAAAPPVVAPRGGAGERGDRDADRAGQRGSPSRGTISSSPRQGGDGARSGTSSRGGAVERGATSRGTSPRGGAVERGGATSRGEGARAPSRGDAPSSSAPPSSGGARRRPGA